MRINRHHHWIEWALRPRRINPVAAHLLLLLGVHAREDGSLEPHMGQIEKALHQPPSVIRVAFQVLKRRKLIEGEDTVQLLGRR